MPTGDIADPSIVRLSAVLNVLPVICGNKTGDQQSEYACRTLLRSFKVIFVFTTLVQDFLWGYFCLAAGLENLLRKSATPSPKVDRRVRSASVLVLHVGVIGHHVIRYQKQAGAGACPPAPQFQNYSLKQ